MSSPQLRSFDDLPGQSTPFTAEDMGRFMFDPLPLMNEQYAIAKAADSEMVRSEMMGQQNVMLFSHDLIKQWQGYELRGQTKRTLPPGFDKLLGKAFLDMYGHEHAEWKKKAMRSFRPTMLDAYIPSIQRSADEVALQEIVRETQQTDAAVHFNPSAKRFAYDIASGFIWGSLISDLERPVTYELFKRMNHLTPDTFKDIEGKDPDSEFSQILRAKDELNAILSDKYLEAEQLIASETWNDKYGDADCLLRGLLQNDAIFDPHGTYDVVDKVEFVQFLTAAAYETSATTLTNLVYCFWKYPEETEKVRQAILRHPQLSDPDTSLTFAMLKDCNELECFISEANRHYSVAPVMAPREVVAEDGLDFGGTVIPKGTSLVIPIKWLHLSEDSWTEADEFKPSRFDKSDGRSKAERGDLGRYNNIPFATGLHKCLGQNLAMLELRMYSVLLLRDYEFELDESMLSAEGTVNGLQTQQGTPHFNVYLKLNKRQ